MVEFREYPKLIDSYGHTFPGIWDELEELGALSGPWGVSTSAVRGILHQRWPEDIQAFVSNGMPEMVPVSVLAVLGAWRAQGCTSYGLPRHLANWLAATPLPETFRPSVLEWLPEKAVHLRFENGAASLPLSEARPDVPRPVHGCFLRWVPEGELEGPALELVLDLFPGMLAPVTVPMGTRTLGEALSRFSERGVLEQQIVERALRSTLQYALFLASRSCELTRCAGFDSDRAFGQWVQGDVEPEPRYVFNGRDPVRAMAVEYREIDNCPDELIGRSVPGAWRMEAGRPRWVLEA